MRFTWWTYRIAWRRAFRREYGAFSRGDLGEWKRWMRLADAIKARQYRESKPTDP